MFCCVKYTNEFQSDTERLKTCGSQSQSLCRQWAEFTFLRNLTLWVLFRHLHLLSGDTNTVWDWQVECSTLPPHPVVQKEILLTAHGICPVQSEPAEPHGVLVNWQDFFFFFPGMCRYAPLCISLPLSLALFAFIKCPLIGCRVTVLDFNSPLLWPVWPHSPGWGFGRSRVNSCETFCLVFN